MLVLQNVHLVPIQGRDPLFSSNIYLLGSDKDLILIDPGEDHWYTRHTAVSATLGYLGALGFPRVGAILHTHHHIDHVSAGPELRKRLRARVIAPAGDAPQIAEWYGGRPPDRLVEDGDTLEVGGWRGRVVHSPGHTAGHICLFFEDPGILFSGDNILGEGTTAIVSPEGDLAQYLASLRALRRLPARIICPGHGPLVPKPRERIDALLRHRAERESQLLSLLDSEGKTISLLTREVYDALEIKPEYRPWAEQMVISTLLKLEREGKVGKEERDGTLFYQRVSRGKEVHQTRVSQERS